ncbi:NifB/NifX family molybdenum-iron cluster-binding protein [Acidianus sp. RZ1]|uniref:NifB/NifX family molybdenum-iron cluster-binding protein n=1 Tax=Acidianus sp. RZ1 TaxID=1540082 RepID=UPI001491F00E|nr:NifB/NifX family molybdenum-iron cluster-binding protein [Acidianus sp. RZ1]NON61844.1 NifB/NifX family molybdenum-iron cluster-binding protein [Acidianus sp. RZ1]
MRVAVPTTNGIVDGPGEAMKVRIYEVSGNEVKLVEEYDIPALKAMAARGVHMLRSAIEKGATSFLLVEIGPPGVRYLSGKAKIYIVPQGTSVDSALNMFRSGKLIETTAPTHEEHHHFI